jgi:hypothetical protein
MVGELTETWTALCEKHAAAFQEAPYRLERPDGSTLPKAVLSPAKANVELLEMNAIGQLPLFEAKCDG